MADIELQLGDENVDEEILESGSILVDDDVREKITSYLIDEIDDVLNGDVRTEMIDKITKWRRQREARPEQKQKDFPWEKASNVTVPLAMMCTNGISSLLKNSLLERDPFWAVEANESLASQNQAEALTNFLDKLSDSPYHIDLKHQIPRVVDECVSLGTQFVKVPWVLDKWTYVDEAGTEHEKVKSASPKLKPVPFENFLTQPYWSDLQRAPWIGEVVYLMEHELLQRQKWGIYQNVEAVLAGGPDEIPDERKEVLERIGVALNAQANTKMYAIVEAYVYEDVDGDGYPEDIVVWIHPETQTVLRSEFNTLGVRPFVRIPYFERPGELYAMGVGWIVEPLQDEVDALHNMRIDGTLLSMLQMYVSSEGSNLAPNEKWRPLKHIQVQEAAKDFQVIKFPDISPSTIQAEYVTKEYADRATGATDAMMGFESFAGSSRKTASGTMFLAKQNLRTLQPVIMNLEASMAEIGKLITFQLIKNADYVRDQLGILPQEQQPYVEEVLNMPLETIPSAFAFRIKTTDLEKTEEAKRQAKLTLVQLYTMYGQQVFQLLPIVYAQDQKTPQPIKEFASKFFVGATKMMDDILRFFGERDVDSYLPYVRDIEMMHELMDGMREQQLGGMRNVRTNSGQMGPGGGGSPGPMGFGGQPGMGGFEGQTPQPSGPNSEQYNEG